ncbi:ankyrin repeat domain-containing protein [Flammeovirga sp. SJP92]|uniref:ankyrin repeat domain-containing protein n=1 Tax=Flammeovirga sp. SJP92 TaxID=1775430 RepID=UPI0007878A34|nr:ankyrin repeat domain-containing protein [Flammeovirga sp. SJP92]KXX72219.1 hypothetical protein AVL50_01055 [Flammeovirga sp. SJP92]
MKKNNIMIEWDDFDNLLEIGKVDSEINSKINSVINNLKKIKDIKSIRSVIGEDLLHLAVSYKNIPFIVELINLGFNINSGDENNNTSMHYYIHNLTRVSNYYPTSEDIEIFKLLLENGGDPNYKNKYGNSPFDEVTLAFIRGYSTYEVFTLFENVAIHKDTIKDSLDTLKSISMENVKKNSDKEEIKKSISFLERKMEDY